MYTCAPIMPSTSDLRGCCHKECVTDMDTPLCIQAEIDSLGCPALSSDSPGEAEPLPAASHFSSGALLERRDMAQESLLQMLEELASKVRSLQSYKRESAARMQALEREKDEAVARAQALERESTELVSLITVAGERVDEILKIGANGDISQPQPVNEPTGSKSPEGLGEFSADPEREAKEHSGKPWRSD